METYEGRGESETRDKSIVSFQLMKLIGKSVDFVHTGHTVCDAVSLSDAAHECKGKYLLIVGSEYNLELPGLHQQIHHHHW